MQKLIYDMMKSAHVTEEELYKKSKIATDFGETLSWKYLCYVKTTPADGRFLLAFCMARTTV